MIQIFFLLAFLVVTVFYILNSVKTLENISFLNRTMSPETAWRMIIPFYNYYFYFVLVRELSTSIENEYRSRNMHIEPNPTLSIGRAAAILTLVAGVGNMLVNLFSIQGLFIGIALILIGLSQIMCFVLHWVSVAGYKNKIKAMPPIEEEYTYTDAEPSA